MYTGTSLWLVPSALDSNRLRTLMQVRLGPQSSTTPSPSSFPAFHPHLTLATLPTSPASTAALRAAVTVSPGAHWQRAPVPLSFKSVDVGPKFFMSVYVAVHAPPGSPLARLRAHLRAALGDSEDPPRNGDGNGSGKTAVPPVPHISLYSSSRADPFACIPS